MSFRYQNKRRRQLDDHRLDDWLMTYADMITLILCFFAIILSVSTVKTEKFEQVKQQVMGKFAAPDGAKRVTAPPLDKVQPLLRLSRASRMGRLRTLIVIMPLK